MRIELPKAIADLKAANIAPADIPQSSIGPGIGIFSRYQAVLEADDTPMTVKTALQLINRERVRRKANMTPKPPLLSPGLNNMDLMLVNLGQLPI